MCIAVNGLLRLGALLLSLTVAWQGATAAAIASAPQDYQIGAGDLLKVGVFGSPDLAGELRVSGSGQITFPYIGQLTVAGLSTSQLEQLLSTQLIEKAIVRQPQVSVLVLEYRSQQIAVMGQVSKPGQYSLAASRRLLDLLAEAGGIINATAADEGTLVRPDGTKVAIDLKALFEGEPGQNLTVGGGDSIFIPKAPQFYIYGEVHRSGAYRLERNMTVSQAISIGGGLTQRGSDRRIVAKRRDASGKEREIAVRGADQVRADDVLLVKESLF